MCTHDQEQTIGTVNKTEEIPLSHVLYISSIQLTLWHLTDMASLHNT
jgi:hypothetical protein